MSELKELLSTKTPKVLKLSEEDHFSADPVEWAELLFESNPGSTTLQVLKNADGSELSIQSIADGARENAQDPPPRLFMLGSDEPAAVKAFLLGVRAGKPYHGRLSLIDKRGSKLFRRQNTEWPAKFFARHFYDAITTRSPLGFNAASTVWLSSGHNIYRAHMDFQDAFLIHLSGEKRIRVWPAPEAFYEKSFYNHNDLDAHTQSEPLDAVLKSGDIAFIPRGAAHELTALDGSPCVSVSIHLGSPYPLLTLCRELNTLLGEEKIYVAPGMDSDEKNRAFYFHPPDYANRTNPGSDGIPDDLARELTQILQGDNLSSDELHRLISTWWRNAYRESSYQSPWPNEWEFE